MKRKIRDSMKSINVQFSEEKKAERLIVLLLLPFEKRVGYGFKWTEREYQQCSFDCFAGKESS